MKTKQTTEFDVQSAYVFSVIAGVAISFVLPPIYFFIGSSILLLCIRHFFGEELGFIGSFIKGLSYTTLLTTVLVVILVLSGGFKGFFTSEFGNHKVNLNNLPLTYILTGTR